ncbi:hypothetical protein A9C11_04535 [Pseudomonas citronellolis]|uniref:Tyr recombinase domain-containing protein n=1 Tax=Pseudomonas citronellolis TaxID=53408 RepID=A0A1A9K6Y8_9PSED|nr:hypothetical protein A9C11_04535 [Pseudomonas citronellolis]
MRWDLRGARGRARLLTLCNRRPKRKGASFRGDILTLQRILGHSSITITMTMRYAHLSPEHLESAMCLSPLAQLSQEQESGEKTELGSCTHARFASAFEGEAGSLDE